MELKEVTEVFAGLELLVEAGKKIGADGKVNVMDLPHLMDLLAKSSILIEAAKGAESIPAELKDLTEDEVKQIVSLVYALVAKIKA